MQVPLSVRSLLRGRGTGEQGEQCDALNKAVETKGGLAGNLIAGGLGVGLGVDAAKKLASNYSMLFFT